MSDDLARMDATDQAELVRTGKVSAAELVEAAIARIEKVNPELNAVIHPLFDDARKEVAGGLPDGPFTGVPLVLKDLICLSAGHPMHEGMRFLEEQGWTEEEDQYLAAKFRAAGFVFVGKTNTPALRRLEHSRGHLSSPDTAPPDADSVDQVIAEAFENLGNGPTLMVGEMMRAAAPMLASLSRNEAVTLMTQAQAAAMGGD